MTSTELITNEYRSSITRLDTVIDECCTAVAEARKANSPMMIALTTAKATNVLREMITDDMLTDIMALQGSHLGFVTDKDNKGGYPVAVIREVMIEAALNGFRMVGNETNVIAGRHYGTKAGYKRKLLEFPGFSNLVLQPGVPESNGQHALVPLIATWKIDGKPQMLRRLKTDEIDRRIPVRVNSGMGADAIIGKAERKVMKEIYELCCGYTVPDVDDEETQETPAAGAGDVVDAAGSSDAKAEGPAGINDVITQYRHRIDKAADRDAVTEIVERLDVELALPEQARDDLKDLARRKYTSLPE